MTITKTFSDGPDSFVVKTADAYDLDFAGGDDFLRILGGTTTAHMGLGDDRVRVDAGSITIFGDDGNDRFYGSGLVSGEIDGGAGNDAFYDFANADVTLAGGAGNDVYRVVSASGPTIVENAGGGIDTVLVARGLSYTLGANLENLRVADTLGSGEDGTLNGNAVNNRITGSSGRDTINGMGGNDVLTGGAGGDAISGGDGNDRIIGGLGGDVLTGGWGADVFVYTSVQESFSISSGNVTDATNVDEIVDFDVNRDLIDLSAIDADTTTPGNQAFIWGGSGVGHLEMGIFAGADLVADTDGDGKFDFYIYFPGISELRPLAEDNFIL
jgi:Ca2+-binding RTX toxin-like protein